MSTDYYQYPDGGGLELSEAGRRIANDPTRCRMHNLDVWLQAEWTLTVAPSGNELRVCSDCFRYWVNESLESVVSVARLSG